MPIGLANTGVVVKREVLEPTGSLGHYSGVTRGTRAFGATLLITALAVATSGCSGQASPAHSRGNTIAAIVSYMPGPGDKQITVRFMRARKDSPGVAEVLDQNDHEVKVLVTYQGSGSLDGFSDHSVRVTLDAPLGNRVVVDDSGQPVALVGLSTEDPP